MVSGNDYELYARLAQTVKKRRLLNMKWLWWEVKVKCTQKKVEIFGNRFFFQVANSLTNCD